VTGFAFGCAGYCDKSSIWQLKHHLREVVDPGSVVDRVGCVRVPEQPEFPARRGMSPFYPQ
jgi:hypothetical protein